MSWSSVVASAVAVVTGVLYYRKNRWGVVVVDRAELRRKVKAIQARGQKDLFVIADFDRTLTSAFTSTGARGHSCHNMLTACPKLSAQYRSTTEQLFKKYYPLETTNKLTREEKIPLMTEWYNKNHNCLVQEDFRHQYLKNAVESSNTELRRGSKRLMKLLDRRNVPLLVFSAGIGDLITLYFERMFSNTPSNVDIISNFMKFETDPATGRPGRLVGFSEPLLHMFNKDASRITGTPFEDDVKGKRSAILLGDSLGDVHMADGWELDNVIKVGFLNAQVPKLLEQYKAVYDVVVINDGPMDCVHSMVLDVLGPMPPSTPKEDAEGVYTKFARSPQHVL